MNASVKKEENMNANQVIKEQLTRFSDPEPGMSEQEREKRQKAEFTGAGISAGK